MNSMVVKTQLTMPFHSGFSMDDLQCFLSSFEKLSRTYFMGSISTALVLESIPWKAP